MLWRQNDEMTPKLKNGKMWYRDFVIWCDSISLDQTCNTTCFISFYKHLENIRGSDISYSYDMNNQLESLTEEVIQLCQEIKEQYKTLNRVDNFIEQLCSGNEQQQFYTAINNTYKRNKTYIEITSEDNDAYYVYVKYGVLSSKPFE